MKQFSLLALAIICCQVAVAQPWVNTNNGSVRIGDAVNNYRTYFQPFIHENDKDKAATDKDRVNKGKAQEEDNDYHFDKWYWYWSQHTDANGYLVSPVKNWNEWNNYKQQNNFYSKFAKTTTNSSNWKFQGPDTSAYGSFGYGLGRINTMAFHPTSTTTFWIGSDGGGAWKTTNNGVTWTSMTDNLPNLSVSDIDFNPLNANTVYMCTGDRDGHEYYGVGVLRSYNGGATWGTTGLNWSDSQLLVANCLIINPQDTNVIIVGASDGIYRSTNAGNSFTKVATGNFKQVLYNAADTNTVYATKFYDRYTAIPAQIFRSTDGGKNWTQVSSFSKVCRVTVAVSPANPRVVKAITSSSDSSNNLFGLEGVYSSSDTGHTFTKIFSGSCSNNLLGFDPTSTATCGGQGWYTLPLVIDPTNINKLYMGGVNAYYSNDGGTTWSILTQWAGYIPSLPTVHADKHFLGFNPLVPSRFFDCNDGSIQYTNNPSPTSTWTDITTGLGITEFYSNAVSNMTTAVIGGAQDNGTIYVEYGSNGILTGGDGMQCQADPTDTNTVYASYVYGTIYLLSNLSISPSSTTISNNIPGIPKGAWLTPYVLEPSCNICIIAGYKQVFLTNDQGTSWSTISPVFDTGRYISSLGVTLKDANTIYAVTADSNIVYATFNLGTSWTKMTAPDSGHISSIEVDYKDKTHFWVTYSGYGKAKVLEYKSSTGWKDISASLPNVPITCSRLDTSTHILYIGSDVGVFYRNDTMTRWQLYNTGLPVVRVSQLNINYGYDQIWAATYGRGMWASPREKFDTTNSHIYVPMVNTEQAFTVAPNPNTGSFTFTTNALFANKRVDMRLVDNIGKTVWSNAGRLDGNGAIRINTSGLAKGIYVFEAAADNEVISKKKVIVD